MTPRRCTGAPARAEGTPRRAGRGDAPTFDPHARPHARNEVPTIAALRRVHGPPVVRNGIGKEPATARAAA